MSQNHKSMESVVKEIAQKHFDLEERLEKMLWFQSEATPKIRLLEINPETPATGMVQSFFFRPSDEVPYPLIIAEVTPEEWQKILRREINLPEGWSLENHKTFAREMVMA